MGEELPLLPETQPNDDEDVVWGLQTATALWARGERREALVWVRRAAEAAGAAGDDARAVELAKRGISMEEYIQAIEAAPAPPNVAAAPKPAVPLISFPEPGERTPPTPLVTTTQVMTLPQAAPTQPMTIGEGGFDISDEPTSDYLGELDPVADRASMPLLMEDESSHDGDELTVPRIDIAKMQKALEARGPSSVGPKSVAHAPPLPAAGNPPPSATTQPLIFEGKVDAGPLSERSQSGPSSTTRLPTKGPPPPPRGRMPTLQPGPSSTPVPSSVSTSLAALNQSAASPDSSTAQSAATPVAPPVSQASSNNQASANVMTSAPVSPAPAPVTPSASAASTAGSSGSASSSLLADGALHATSQEALRDGLAKDGQGGTTVLATATIEVKSVGNSRKKARAPILDPWADDFPIDDPPHHSRASHHAVDAGPMSEDDVVTSAAPLEVTLRKRPPPPPAVKTRAPVPGTVLADAPPNSTPEPYSKPNGDGQINPRPPPPPPPMRRSATLTGAPNPLSTPPPPVVIDRKSVPPPAPLPSQAPAPPAQIVAQAAPAVAAPAPAETSETAAPPAVAAQPAPAASKKQASEPPPVPFTPANADAPASKPEPRRTPAPIEPKAQASDGSPASEPKLPSASLAPLKTAKAVASALPPKVDSKSNTDALAQEAKPARAPSVAPRPRTGPPPSMGLPPLFGEPKAREPLSLEGLGAELSSPPPKMPAPSAAPAPVAARAPSIRPAAPAAPEPEAPVEAPPPAVAEAAPQSSGPPSTGSIPPAERSVAGLPLDRIEAFADLPGELQKHLAATAHLVEIGESEEVKSFGTLVVISGVVDVAATIADIAAGMVVEGGLITERTSVQDVVAMRVVAPVKAKVATWSRETMEEALKTCPWVLDELTRVGDRFAALVGATMGPVGDLDDESRRQTLDRFRLKNLRAGETLAEKGADNPGLVVVGGGTLLIGDDGAVSETLNSGDLLFPNTVLDGSPSPHKVRAGDGGALLLVAPRSTTVELFSTLPMLLELLRVA